MAGRIRLLLMYSFSTCWNSQKHTDGRAMLREIRELGFDHAELSHGTRVSLLPGIIEAVEAGEIKISSLHNFCPLPMGVNFSAPNLYRFTSENPAERSNALRCTRKTIELAARLKAPVVVLHYGAAEMKDYTGKLLGMAGSGMKGTPKYEKLCAEVLRKRESAKERPVERANELLRQLLPEAESLGIKLGIENREALEELPLEADYQLLFKSLANPAAVYWHDTGHAQIKENLGFLDHAFHLEAQRERLFGFHIHDTAFPGQDHCAPGTGTVNFAALKPMVRPEHIKVFEFSPMLTVEEVKAGVAHVRKIWGGE
jgi:sugar phosphate isomerase/epimerase